MSNKPSVGRMVHYQSYGSAMGEYRSLPRAAVITEVDWKQLEPGADPVEVVSIAVLNPTGMFFQIGVPYSEEPLRGHWSWPPQV